MRPEQKTKSRAKLYNALSGGKEITGAAGQPATGSIQFADTATDGETVTIGGYVFEFDSTGEAAGTSAGTAADPHLVDQGATVITTAANLAAAVLAETETTGKWGYLHPIDAVGASGDGVDTLDLTFWPGVWANSVTLAGSATDETITQPSGGVDMPVISQDVNANVIDTTGSATNQEYYSLADGNTVGQEVKVLVKTFAAGDTPSILGHLKEDGVAMVECEFITGEPGAYVTFMWDGAAWSQTSTSALNTQPDYSPSA